jgi:hypothetical protein
MMCHINSGFSPVHFVLGDRYLLFFGFGVDGYQIIMSNHGEMPDSTRESYELYPCVPAG